MPPPVDRPLEHVLVESRRYRIEGDIMLPPEEGYRSRLSDFLNDKERDFLIVLNAKMARLDDPEQTSAAPVVMLHRSRIDLIIPLAGV